VEALAHVGSGSDYHPFRKLHAGTARVVVEVEAGLLVYLIQMVWVGVLEGLLNSMLEQVASPGNWNTQGWRSKTCSSLPLRLCGMCNVWRMVFTAS
jgi:hypothetical protein